jgi:hypothetical protein
MIDKIDCEFAITVDGKEKWKKGYYLTSISVHTASEVNAIIICRDTGKLIRKTVEWVRFPQFAVHPK